MPFIIGIYVRTDSLSNWNMMLFLFSAAILIHFGQGMQIIFQIRKSNKAAIKSLDYFYWGCAIVTRIIQHLIVHTEYVEQCYITCYIL